MHRRFKYLGCLAFFGMLALPGLVALVSSSHMRGGMVKHAFFCTCCPHDSLSRQWLELEKFLERNVGETVLGANAFVSFNGMLHSIMGRRTVFDPRYQYLIKSDTGYLWHPLRDARSKQEQIVAEILQLRAALPPGTPLVVAIAPDKSVLYDGVSFPAVGSYSTTNLNVFFSLCRREKINCLDLRNVVTSERDFFRTDHHWNTEAAFKAYRQIAAWIGDNVSRAIVCDLDIRRFKRRTYPLWFLGSAGRRTGRWFSGLDDYDLFLPELTARFQMAAKTNTGRTIVREGSFEDVVLQREQYESKDVTCNRYGAYFGRDYASVVVTNGDSPGGRVLLIKDSFALPVAAFLALSCRELSFLDIRYYRRFGSINEYAASHAHDVVLLLYNSGMLCDPGMFDFVKSGAPAGEEQRVQGD